MRQKIVAVCFLLAVILVIYYSESSGEHFANKDEKAAEVLDWFKLNPVPRYVDFRDHFKRQSNIVEYEDVKNLQKDNQLTLANVKKRI